MNMELEPVLPEENECEGGREQGLDGNQVMSYVQIVEWLAKMRISAVRAGVEAGICNVGARFVVDGPHLDEYQRQWLTNVRKFLRGVVGCKIEVCKCDCFINECYVLDRMIIALGKREISDQRLLQDFVNAYLDSIAETIYSDKTVATSDKRKLTFSRQFVDDVEKLCLEIINNIVVNCGKKPILAEPNQ